MLHLKKIADIASKQADQIAINYYENSLTWSQLKHQTENKITYLTKRYGNNLPSQVCYISNNRVDLFPWLATFATLSIPVTGLDYTLPIKTIQTMARNIGADFILISSRSLNLADKIPDLGLIRSTGSTIFDLDSADMAVIDASKEEQYPTNNNINFPVKAFRSIGFTSGTYGLPKAVLRNKSFDQRRFQYFTTRYAFNHHDRFMVSMPMYHAAGNGWARLFMSLGATLYVVDSDDTQAMAHHLDVHNITATVLSPILLANVLKLRENHHLMRPKSLKWVLVGGRNFTEVEKKHALDNLGPVVYEYYEHLEVVI